MNRNKLQLLGAMGIFGTVGFFVKLIPMDSASIAFFRGVLGVAFLLTVMLLTGKKPDLPAIGKKLLLLTVSGAAIGLNWVALFEAYRYTTVATATVCYYLAPLFLLLAAPLVGERLKAKSLIYIGTALIGTVFISGIMESGIPSPDQLRGIALAVGAAVLYACVMLLNKKLTPVPAYDKTVIQLSVSALMILPYMLLAGGFSFPQLTAIQWGLLVLVGIVHTGIAYAMYFGSMNGLSAHTIAIFSYLDPVIAVLLSAAVLREPIGFWGGFGAVLILGSALCSELSELKK